METKTWTKEEQAEHRKQWVEALRSGEYRQGRGLLRADDGTFCCLGVATNLAVGAGVVRDEDGGAFTSLRIGFGRSVEHRVSLAREVQDWLGLRGEEGELTNRGHRATGHAYLTNLNDIAGYTFDQLADIIERGDVLLEGEEA